MSKATRPASATSPLHAGTKRSAPRRPRPARAGKDRFLVRIHDRVTKLRDWLSPTAQLLRRTAAVSSPEVQVVIDRTLKVTDEWFENTDEVLRAVFQLKDAGWVMPKRSPALEYQPNQLVEFRRGREQRYLKDGAYTAEDLKTMRVVSIHGRSLKLASNNETLGLVPASWVRKLAADVVDNTTKRKRRAQG